MDSTIRSTEEGIIDLEEIAKTQHLPFDWRQIIEKGPMLFDHSRMTTIHLKSLPKLQENAYFLLIGERNLERLNDPDYKFHDVVSYLNAVEKYHYMCLKNNHSKNMNDFCITIANPSEGIYPNIINKKFRQFIAQ